MHRTLIYVEQEHQKDALDLLFAAGLLHADEPYELYGLVINGDVASLVGSHDVVFSIDEDQINLADPVVITNIISGLAQTYGFDCFLFSATRLGNMIAARLAVRLDVGVVTDVSEIIHQDQSLQFLRPGPMQKLKSAVVSTGNGPIILTIRSGSFPGGSKAVRDTKIVKSKGAKLPTVGIRSVRQVKKTDTDIRDCDVLISGGAGIAHDFEALEPLAKALGGQISASRAIVDRGLASKRLQVGQSGNRVSPRLYMAFGIHGAIQHVIALEDVETIISVNTNVNAPINSLADIVVAGDALTFADKLLKRIKEK